MTKEELKAKLNSKPENVILKQGGSTFTEGAYYICKPETESKRYDIVTFKDADKVENWLPVIKFSESTNRETGKTTKGGSTAYNEELTISDSMDCVARKFKSGFVGLVLVS